MDGAAGPEGPAGMDGDDGMDGQQGPRGNQGNTGPEGPAGAAGAAGPAGAEGAAGPAGPEGPAGSQGPEGPQGDQGDQGNQGNTGPEGPEGPQGPAGADGTAVNLGGFTVPTDTQQPTAITDIASMGWVDTTFQDKNILVANVTERDQAVAGNPEVGTIIIEEDTGEIFFIDTDAGVSTIHATDLFLTQELWNTQDAAGNNVGDPDYDYANTPSRIDGLDFASGVGEEIRTEIWGTRPDTAGLLPTNINYDFDGTESRIDALVTEDADLAL